MEGSVKTIASILALLTVAFGGYYLYVQQSPSGLGAGAEDQQMVQNMLARTQVFIERSQELDRMSLDLSVLEDQRFRSLISFSKPVKEQPAGRSDPFAPVGE